MPDRLKVAFAGTPEFARAALTALLEAGHEVPLVLTQPDRPAGRGLKLQASPVKLEAQRHGLTVLQPRSLRLDGKYPDDARATRQALQACGADVWVVAAYGLILPAWALSCRPRGCVNIHGSLLPRWRGAAPIQRAIEAGDTHTGITLMQMDEGLDTGPMIAAEALPIGAADTSATLHDALAALGARLLVQHLPAWVSGTLPAVPQPAQGATYATKIDKSEAAIDWAAPAEVIERRLRAFDPFPGATFTLGAETVKLWRARVVPGRGAPGECLAGDSGTLRVACGEGALDLLDLQRTGGRRVAVADFLRGHAVPAGTLLGGRPR